MLRNGYSVVNAILYFTKTAFCIIKSALTYCKLATAFNNGIATIKGKEGE
jgi:hypothetical protein